MNKRSCCLSLSETGDEGAALNMGHLSVAAKNGAIWQDCGPPSAGSNYFHHFPAQRAGRLAFLLFLRA
jgi:hypothetical protein